MKRQIFIALTLCVALLASAQSRKAYDKFRKDMKEKHEKFRKSALDEYAEFMESAWAQYEAFSGVERDPKPKPAVQPVAPKKETPKVDVTPVAPKPVDKPKDEQADKPKPQDKGKDKPKPQEKPKDKSKDKKQDKPKQQDKPEPKQQDKPVTPVAPSTKNMVTVAYKDITTQLPKVAPAKLSAVNSQSITNTWREIVAAKDMDKAMAAFDSEVDRMKLPDWWAMNLAVNYGDALMPNDHNSALVFAAVLMVNRGCDLKLAMSDQVIALLFNTDAMIYGRPYFKIDGKQYFMLGQEKLRTVSTYSVPKDKNTLNSVSLRIADAPVLPQRMQQFTITDGHLTITGEVDAAMAERLRDYPQMEIPEYASSVLQPDLRNSLRKQLREQTSGMTEWEAANALISLVQHGFKYATDQEQFGYEKPFFMEELLYWPKCDCEDRSVFYTWIAREVLGVDAHLLHYPGHEATAVALGENAKGSGYDYDGRYYYIADPTYIGAPVGMCMPQFVNISPEIQLIK